MADLVKKDIRYLSRDFPSLKQNLIDFAKNYFPDTYQDFNESSPGMMFLEMAAYVGDVLSYYTDTALQESLILQASERQNILDIAQSLGYKPKTNIASNVKLDVFQIVPSIGGGVNNKPDFSYAFAIEPGMVVASDNRNISTEFRTTDYLDFKFSSSFDPTEVTIFEVDDITDEPTFYLLKKSVNAVSGVIKTKTYTFGEPKPYDKIELEESTLIDILYAIDSDGNKWYHVPFLAQDTIFEPTPNIARNDRQLSTYREETPYLLKLRKVSRRFSSRQLDNGKTEIQFGAGVSDLDDELLIPNPDLIGSSLVGMESIASVDIDPSNFLYTKTYGLAPNNTELTLYYTVGGGIKDNVPSETITRLKSRSILLDETGLNQNLYRQAIGSLAVTNPEPAVGAKQSETVDEIRQNALAYFASQNRAVTKEDYIIRAYSLPQKYGSIAKAYITKDDQLTAESIYNSDRVVNPLALNFYVLGYDSNGNLTRINDATKENLKLYLGHHRMLTDAINIKDAYIINLGIEFDIITMPDQNGNQVILRCIDRLKKYFDIKKWQVNQPIVISNIYTELDKVEGVQTVVDVRLVNLYDPTLGYSGNAYNIQLATRDGILFPSLDPSIFEIKYPNNDIIGRVRAFG
jgi:phage-related baseplate assembly protein